MFINLKNVLDKGYNLQPMASDVSTGVQELKELLDLKSNREYRSTVFTSYFGEADNAARLYESLVLLEGESPLSGASKKEETKSVAPEDIEFATLEGVLYLARKNDLAFTVRRKVLVIGEHQSTINQNMPLRSAIYYGRTMEKLVDPKAMYRSRRVGIPTPEFYVFYNGRENQPLEQTLYLSDSYLEKTDSPMLELKVNVININLPECHPLLSMCRPLYEYSWFIWRVREYLERGRNRDEAIGAAMEDCVSQGIMTEFIRKHGSEVRNMLFGEFVLEDAKEVWEEEAREEGHEEGRKEGADYLLVQQVSKKLRRGKSAKVIADELETEPGKIRKICEAAEAYAPDYDPEAVFKAMQNRTAIVGTAHAVVKEPSA